ncbi:MAG TPA: LCP family protein [Spirochaetia bacterium]|nr:LCP family protein [Spirochaetia bacterium]
MARKRGGAGKKGLAAVLILLLCGTLGAGALYRLGWFRPQTVAASEPAGVTTPAAPQQPINVLLLGTDQRAGMPSGRTDTMILASFDPARNQVSLLSVPRDSLVAIPGHGTDKINNANVYGGPELAMQTVSQLLGVPVDNYVLVNFSGFESLVNSLGGVTVDISQAMYHYDPMDGGIYTIDLPAGEQHLDGAQALEYVRYRDFPLGDITRTADQQSFITTLVQKALEPQNLVKLPVLLPGLLQDVQTNLPLSQMLDLAGMLGHTGSLQTVTQTVPGSFQTINGVSYWIVDPATARTTAREVLAGTGGHQVVMGPGSDSGQGTM